MSGCSSRPAAFSGFMLPPYWIRTPSPRRTQHRADVACAACAISGVAVRPVPIAHTGS